MKKLIVLGPGCPRCDSLAKLTAQAADQIGIELAAKAGYDPRASVTLWQKMGTVGGEGPPAFLSTHPTDVQRQQRLGALVPGMMPYYESNITRPRHPVSVGVAN